MLHKIRWTIDKLKQRLNLIEPLVYRRTMPLLPFRYHELADPVSAPLVEPDVDDSRWSVIEPDTYWGKPATNFILRTAFTIPAEWGADMPVGLFLPLGDARNFSHPEALVYIDGQPFAASDRHHREVLLRPEWADQRSHSLALHGWTGLGGNWGKDKVSVLLMKPCALVLVDQPIRDFFAAARVALNSAESLDENDPAWNGLLNALNAAFQILDTREPFGPSFYASVAPALAALRQGIAQAGAPLNVVLTATGHAHIDVAWLWTLDQTRRKAGRTFYTVTRLMEQFTDYHFTQSQPQLYEYIRQDYPNLFQRIKDLVQAGRWEPTGGMWVEADCNLSGAESLARQFLLGRTYFREQFGRDAESPILWLPDVFGYAWALPQLIKLAGLDYFFTIKLGWNQYNRIPYDSFWWQGLDGTRVLTHFSTAPEHKNAPGSTYNAPATPESALGAWKNFQQKDAQSEVFMAFGYGDGGGGPTREMLENLQLLGHFPGMPQVRQRPALEFFRAIEQESGGSLPTWNGELYLELHRGTYTSQSRNKRANRKSEFLLHDAEFLSSLAASVDPDYSYPHDTFTRAWRLVCLNQFHDIIPGSSIGEVYADSLRQYAALEEMTGQVIQPALQSLSRRIGGAVLVANPTSFRSRSLAFLPGDPVGRLYRDGVLLESQPAEDGLWFDPGELEPYSVTSFMLQPGPELARVQPAAVQDTPILENEVLLVVFNSSGDIIRIYDKTARREVLPTGEIANQFQAFEDRPKFWEAWDVDIFYDDKVYFAEPADSIRMVEAGPLRQTIEIQRNILNSRIIQKISLERHSGRLDFNTHVDWHERHILLKVAFPVDILSPAATFDIQWGNVQRPTHRNTSWDWARFETCAQKWADLSEGGYGVSLLNDCKYGYDVGGNVLRLSLLRSPTTPDPEADQGAHQFIYSLLPHSGGWEAAAAHAYALNDPLIVHRTGSFENLSTAGIDSLVRMSSQNVIIETVKMAEDGDGLIVRLYESERRRGEVTLETAFTLAAVEKTNLLEESLEALHPDGRRVNFFVRPYEIITLRLRPVQGLESGNA